MPERAELKAFARSIDQSLKEWLDPKDVDRSILDILDSKWLEAQQHTATLNQNQIMFAPSDIHIITARRLVLPGDLQGRSRHVDDDHDDDD